MEDPHVSKVANDFVTGSPGVAVGNQVQREAETLDNGHMYDDQKGHALEGVLARAKKVGCFYAWPSRDLFALEQTGA